MIVQYYKPNSKNTGCAVSFDIGPNQKNKEPCVFVRAIKQFSWNQDKRTGSFSENSKNPDKSISLKLCLSSIFSNLSVFTYLVLISLLEILKVVLSQLLCFKSKVFFGSKSPK